MTRKQYRDAATIIQQMSKGIPEEFICPLPEGDGAWFGSVEVFAGIAVWTAREAFVTLFARDNPRFDADRFRAACSKHAE